MRQAQRKKEKDKIAIALMLAFCVIALTSIFTIKSNIDKINGSQTNVPVSEKINSADSQTAETESEPVSPSSKNVPTVDSQNSAGVKQKNETLKKTNFILPIRDSSATVTNEYAMDSLIYSVTLDQYMTHCGIDIEAPEDSQVLAAANGTVTGIYEDDRYGASIELTHPGGFVTTYSNLSTTELVEVGDDVKQGDVVGGVGSSGLFESLEPAHLHLEMLKDGIYVNPQDYIKY